MHITINLRARQEFRPIGFAAAVSLKRIWHANQAGRRRFFTGSEEMPKGRPEDLPNARDVPCVDDVVAIGTRIPLRLNLLHDHPVFLEEARACAFFRNC